MSKTPSLFGSNLRHVVKKSGMTFTEAASKFEISRSFLNQLMAGEREPSTETINVICSVLELSRSDLFERDLETQPAQRSEVLHAPFLEKTLAKLNAVAEEIRALDELVSNLPPEKVRPAKEAVQSIHDGTASSSLEIQRKVKSGIDKFKEQYKEIIPAWDAWPNEDGKGEWRRHVALFFLTRDNSHLDHHSIPKRLREGLLGGLKFFAIHPQKPVPKK